MTHTGHQARSPASIARRRFDGVIFDMDGTLVQPLLDFAAIRAKLRIPAGVGILEAIDAMTPDAQAEAHKALLDWEMAAAQQAQPMPGALPTLQAIRRQGLKMALLTRNAAPAMALVIQRLGMQFDLAWSREQGPIKPAPDGVLRACRALGLAPGRTLCVGDFEYDIQAANAAGAVSVLLATDAGPAFATCPHHTITALGQLLGLLDLPGQEA